MNLEMVSDRVILKASSFLTSEYTDEELKEIGRIKGQILAKMAKSAVKDLKKQMEDLSKQLEGGLEGFMEEINN